MRNIPYREIIQEIAMGSTVTEYFQTVLNKSKNANNR